MISCGVKSDRISARRLNLLNMRGFSEGKIRPQLIIGVVVNSFIPLLRILLIYVSCLELIFDSTRNYH